ncbi:MAG: PIN domain-containing protein [Nitrospirae bacterium]|nr:PIN domain-containing protein [Nitrospirota bacterium]
MSYSVDVNVLLCASDRASPHHAGAVRFLEARTTDPELCCLAWPVLMAYVRIATHPRVFAHPLSPADALGNIQALLDLHRVRVLSEADGFLDVYRNVTTGLSSRGNLVPDAHLAAILRQHDVRTLYTTDADFRKFPFLDVQNPLA